MLFYEITSVKFTFDPSITVVEYIANDFILRNTRTGAYIFLDPIITTQLQQEYPELFIDIQPYFDATSLPF